MARDEDIVYHIYRKNVPYYNVGVRKSIHDADGVILTNEYPTIRIEDKDHRDFLRANKYPLEQGLIRKVEDEAMEWEKIDSLSDEAAIELLKNYAKLKSVLSETGSFAMVQKLHQFAVEREAPAKTRSLIKARFDELAPDEDFYTKATDREQ